MINIEERHLIIVREILSQAKGVKFYAFGSRVTGKNQKFSDLDICYEGSFDQQILSKIKNDLYESNLPYKVDLVAISKLPETFIDTISKQRILIV